MAGITADELINALLPLSEDPEIRARTLDVIRSMVNRTPLVREEIALEEAQKNLRRVSARRKLVLRPEDEARIDACTDLATIERWHDQAIDATSIEEALR